MHVAELWVRDFRSYESAHLELAAGKTAIVGANGQGKTNLVEAIDYLSSLSSHRVANDAPLVRHGAESAHVGARVVKDGRNARLEIDIVPRAGNKARVNKAPLNRARDLIGVLRTVVFAPDDVSLVKGDPSVRRHLLDQVNALRAPRLAGVRSDYDRVLKQRNALLKSARAARASDVPSTLEIWDQHLVDHGAALVSARLSLIEEIAPYLEKAYAKVASLAAQNRQLAHLRYASRTDVSAGPDTESVREALRAQIAERRREELDRGISLVGPHRDDVTLSLGELPAKGYASHGETWSYALALRLATFGLLRADGDDPVLILDDVFAELDSGRREQLSELVDSVEQVMVTAAVAGDVPAAFADQRFLVEHGRVVRDE